MKVSVIIPTYNRAELVQLTIDSVLQQSFRDFEIIVIDDGSVDDTEQALLKYRDDIVYLKQENKGINSARNYGLSLAKGEYVALLDSDDLWFPSTLQLYVDILDNYPDVSLTFSNFYVMKPDGVKHQKGLDKWHRVSPDWQQLYEKFSDIDLSEYSLELAEGREQGRLYLGDIYYSSLFGPRVLPSASLYRRSIAETAGLKLNEKDSYCGDWAFFAEISRTYKVAYIDIEASINRSHNDEVRLTRADHRVQLTHRLKMMDNVWKKDGKFVERHADKIENEELYVAFFLLKLHLKHGDSDDAVRVWNRIKKLQRVKKDPKYLLAFFLMHMPGISSMYNTMRRIRSNF